MGDKGLEKPVGLRGTTSSGVAVELRWRDGDESSRRDDWGRGGRGSGGGALGLGLKLLE